MGLSYTFLGTEDRSENQTYTPLIVPGGLPFDYANFISSEATFSRLFENAEDKLATPFSQIRNYYKNNLDSPSYMPIQTVNVLDDYAWTISPRTSKMGKDAQEYSNDNYRNVNDEVPYIYLKEKYFLVNNIIAQALYSLSVFEGTKSLAALQSFITGGKNTINSGIRLIDNTIGKGFAVFEEPTRLPNGEAAAGTQQRIDYLGQIGTAIGDSVLGANSNLDTLYTIFKKYNNPDLEAVLFPYQKLYFVGPTGFNYKLPYLNAKVLDVNNNFGDSAENVTGQLIDLVNSGTGAAEAILGTFNLFSQAGTAKIERAKHYQYPNEGPPIEVVFPLYNTSPSTYEDVCNNFKLVLLLTYQNLPLRQDKVVVEPPVMYDLTIPGNRRAPYCYISSLVVNYRGSTRLMDINTAGLASSDSNISIPQRLKTIVPEMYEIRMTFQPMVATTKNLLFSTITDAKVKVRTGPIDNRPELNSENINSFTPQFDNINANITDFGAIA